MATRYIPVAAQVRALCCMHPLRPKVIFVPRVQIGQSIEQAVARSRRGKDGPADRAWGGLSCLVPRQYAERLAAPRLLPSGRRELRPVARRFLAARLTGALEAEAFDELPGPAHFAGSVAQAIESLRAKGTEPARVRAVAESDTASRVLGVVARCYAAYERALEEERLYDDADLLRWGREEVSEKTPADVTATVFAVLGDAELSKREAELLHALETTGHAFYRIGETRPATAAPPEESAAALFAHAPLPEGDHGAAPVNEEERERTVCRAVGASNEVRAVFRKMLDRGVAFDDVEIALAQGEPYRGLVADVADRVGIDVTFSTGRPALRTRTGQALKGLYEWIQGDFDPALLIRLLRDGLVCVEGEAERLNEEESRWSGPELATWLAARRYEPGRAGYERAFAVAEGDLDREITRLEEKGLDATREKGKRHRTHVAQKVVAALLDLVPQGRTTVEEMARMSRKFLRTFGPVESPRDIPEAERSLEEAARGVLYQKMRNLRDLPVAHEASPRRLASMLQEALERQYVQSERPRPGAAHVVPLERAAFSGRPHLFILGLGSELLAASETDEALLAELDDERAGAESREQRAAREEAPADKTAWRARRALRRHTGPRYLFASVYDVESGEERFPAALFLEEEDALKEAGALEGVEVPRAGFLPALGDEAAEKEHVLIDERAAWLAAHADVRSRELGKEEEPSAQTRATARAAACERYAWLRRAQAAREARASETHTFHDGLLGEGAFSELDFTAPAYDGPPLSAGRLETFAQTPYLYFLKYVLGVRPLDEPALEDAGWLDPRRHGSILHNAFERFMTGRGASEPVRLGEEEALWEALGDALDEAKRKLASPSDRVEAASLRKLRADARVFLRAEASRAEASGASPWGHERGFGYGPRRAREGDLGDAEITFANGLTVPLRGRIDRIDRREDGTLAVWDYKTGSAGEYDQSEPLAEGSHLQWALYAYVLEALTEEDVRSSGYFFTSTKEMGARLSNAPARYREEVGEIVNHLGRMARAGWFPMNPSAPRLSAWKWSGYAALFPDLRERTKEVKAKADPSDRPDSLYR